MVDDSDHLKHADHAIAMLKAVYLRDGADVAVQAAKHMISAAAALITCEYGPDEARPHLADRRRGTRANFLSLTEPIAARASALATGNAHRIEFADEITEDGCAVAGH